ncbi:MAG: BON domain-containing protein [Acidobacteria bacterium]|nr:BON domain-containing protein [Acidobacteriota bacterium]MBV9474859.1 BON domain-containing protein [Acidobacteriota bacterium]
MGIDRTPNRGMFGYEGEGFDYTPGPRGYRDLENDRSWNVGHADDRGARPSYRGRGPKNYQRGDDRIREDICERLADDDDVDATDIEVSVSGGVVVLTGSVNERHAKRLAEDLAESVRGVREVENNIRVTR